jgi:dodecin
MVHDAEAWLDPCAGVFSLTCSMEVHMTDSVYKVVTLVGTSTESWEKAAKTAVDAASHSLRELRIAEVIKQDMVIRMARWKPTGPRSGCPSNMRATSNPPTLSAHAARGSEAHAR